MIYFHGETPYHGGQSRLGSVVVGMTQAVKDLLARMQAQLPPPTHLRGDAKAKEQFLADYERVLSGWSTEVLHAAWPIVLERLQFWIWPRPQQINDACKEIADEFHKPTDMGQRREDALAMTNRYVGHYLRHSKLASIAKEEGWLKPLTNFVNGSAWVQAQLLCNVDPIGWDTPIAEHLGEFHSSREGFELFRPTIAGGIERGRIEVRVPPTLIRSWKQHARAEPGQDRQSGGQFAG